jgi:integrase
MPRKHRRRSWGSITESVKGRKYVLRWVENTPDGRKRRTKTVYGTYREACMELDRLHVEKSDDRPTMTVGEVYTTWYLPDMERRVSLGTLKKGSLNSYTKMWRNHISKRWENVPVDSVKPMDVQEWLLSMPKQTASTCIAVIRVVMDYAVRYELVPTNKFRERYQMPTDAAWRKSKATIPLKDAEAVFNSIRDDTIEPAFIIACFGGARTGEALGVKCSEVRELYAGGMSFAVVPIRRRVADDGTLTDDGDLKNRQSLRETLIPGVYGERLLRIARDKERAGFELLTSYDGTPISKSSLGSALRKHVDMPFANLRNSWRTFAQFEWGIDHETLEILMGHVLPGVSGKHYIRPDIKQIAERFAEAYSG